MEYLTNKEIENKTGTLKGKFQTWDSWTLKQGNAEEIIRKYIPLSDDLEILDCGTGNGTFLKQLHTLGFTKLYATDIDNYLSDEARGFVKDFQKVDLSFDRLSYGDNKFDLITAWCVIPHLENPFHFMREVHRLLKPGGLFIFSTININSGGHRKYFYQNGELPGYHEKNNHISIITNKVLRKTAQKYFDFIGLEELIAPRIFKGALGRFRKIAFFFFKNYLQKRWGAKIAYILRRK